MRAINKFVLYLSPLCFINFGHYDENAIVTYGSKRVGSFHIISTFHFEKYGQDFFQIR